MAEHFAGEQIIGVDFAIPHGELSTP
jgi:hypothetical protein